MTDWQPIETAPKSGADILVTLPVYGSDLHPTKPNKLLGWECAVIEACQVGAGIDLECGWNTNDFTHWMPLPEPPEGK